MSVAAPNALQSAIHKLAFHEPLTGEDAERAFDVVMRGEATAVQIAAVSANSMVPLNFGGSSSIPKFSA